MARRRRRAEDFVPLPVSEFHILLALADAELHGYAIMSEVASRTGGAVVLGPGTLYGAVKRMLGAGLIEESDRRPAAGDDDERRRYYALSSFGREVATAEARRLAQLVKQAREKRLLGRLETA